MKVHKLCVAQEIVRWRYVLFGFLAGFCLSFPFRICLNEKIQFILYYDIDMQVLLFWLCQSYCLLQNYKAGGSKFVTIALNSKQETSSIETSFILLCCPTQ